MGTSQAFFKSEMYPKYIPLASTYKFHIDVAYLVNHVKFLRRFAYFLVYSSVFCILVASLITLI